MAPSVAVDSQNCPSLQDLYLGFMYHTHTQQSNCPEMKKASSTRGCNSKMTGGRPASIAVKSAAAFSTVHTRFSQSGALNRDVHAVSLNTRLITNSKLTKTTNFLLSVQPGDAQSALRR